MARGPRKHLKRLNAPKHWMLSKLGGKWAPRPSCGPHKLRESFPLILILRNRLKYALNKREVTMILMQRFVKVDGKVRTDATYPCGFMDVISIEKSNESFRLLFDTKGRFCVNRIGNEEAKFKLCKVKKTALGAKAIPYIVTHDGRTIRYPDPEIKVNDTVKFDLREGKIVGHIAFDIGKLAYITGGHNIGRIGTISHREKHKGANDIIYVKDKANNSFATTTKNVFVIGHEADKSWVALPKLKGVRLSIIQDRKAQLEKKK